MDFGTAKGIEFIMIFAVIVGSCLYQLHAVNRDARLSAQRRAAEAAPHDGASTPPAPMDAATRNGGADARAPESLKAG
jgi:hypothetical protein